MSTTAENPDCATCGTTLLEVSGEAGQEYLKRWFCPECGIFVAYTRRAYRNHIRWTIGCVIFAVLMFHIAYTAGTAETHEQCIAGGGRGDDFVCTQFETRPGPSRGAVFGISLVGIGALGTAVSADRMALRWTLLEGLHRWLPVIMFMLMSIYIRGLI